MRTSRILLVIGIFWPALLSAAVQRGRLRAADQPVPGATVTARQGGAKVIGYTDESGQYALDLTPGEWSVEIEMLGFTPLRGAVNADTPTFREWTIEIPRPDDPAPAPPVTAAPVAAAATHPNPRSPQVSAPSREAAARPRRQAPVFQSAAVHATDTGRQALTEAAAEAPAPAAEDEDSAEALLVNGSTSGGLAAASDEEAKRQRSFDRGVPGGGDGGSFPERGMMPGMAANPMGESLGLGGFGASAVTGGFSGGLPGDAGGDRGPGGFDRGGRGRGGPGGGGGARKEDKRRGGTRGQFASFGNRRRTQPAITGSAYLNLNNSALNAAPFSLNGQAAQKPSYAQSRFGLSAGGPLHIPKLVNWQRASYYFTYSGTRSRNPFNEVAALPTAAQRTGDFSGIKNVLYDSLSGVPFAGNVLPQSRLDAAARGLLRFFPQPTYSAGVQNYRIVRSIPNVNDNFGARLNAPLSRRDRITFSANLQWRDSQSLTLYGFRDSSDGGGRSYALGWSHSFAPRLNNSANFNFSRNRNEFLPYFAYRENVAAELGIAGTAQDAINWGPPGLIFTNFGGLTDGTASLSRNQTASFSDGITYVVKKKHNLTAGFSYRRMQVNSLSYQNARGQFSFSGLVTSLVNSQGRPSSGTGYDFADFLLGAPQSSTLRYGSNNNYFRGWAASAYSQDDYRVTKNVSLNLGLRYEYFSPFTELNGHLANLDVAPGFAGVAVVTPGVRGPYSGELPDSLVRADGNNLSPRVGISWRPAGKRGMVVRGGYSIFYSGSAYQQLAAQMASQPPFARTASLTTSSTTPLSLTNGFPVVEQRTITNTFAIDPNYKIAYAQTWVAAVQNPLPHGLLAELEYIGTKGTNLSIVEQPNKASPGASILNAQNLLPIANASGFNYQTAQANSIYNAGQVRITRRFQRGMSGTALYMYSRAIDNASSYNGSGGTVVQFLEDLRLERGLSNFDQRHRLQTTFLLSSPVGVHGWLRNGGWKTRALAGWTLSGSFNATSGTPLTARVGGNLSNLGGTAAFGTGRAQATGQGIHEGGYPYFNLLAFAAPPAGQYGNAGRNTITGPMVTALQASLNRAFRFGDTRRQLQLRLSANNVFNHVVITGFGTTVNAATYGLPTAASATRTVTLLMRFNF